MPTGGYASLTAFPGDFALLAGLFALGRFAMMLAALDTGSAFEGMGAAREALLSALAEPVFLFCLMLLCHDAGSWSLGYILGGISLADWATHWPFLLLIAFSLFFLLLVENCRILVDDPTTHLELTMIHEAMLLDHSGPDLAILEYASALKLWIFCLLISGTLLPACTQPLFTPTGALNAGAAALALNIGDTLLCIFALAILAGFMESSMARLRMERTSQPITLAGAFACMACLFLWKMP